jgi:hypothetical protein
MKKIFFFIAISISTITSYSQSHVDSTYGYKIVVPQWWNIRETPPNMFGGTFPAIESIENALLFKSFEKAKYKSFADFENWVVKDYSMGQSPKWSSQHTFMLKKQIDDFKEIGNAYKVQILRGNKLYDCCYILIETANSFVWIDFTATSTTYTKNWDKFKEIANSFTKL